MHRLAVLLLVLTIVTVSWAQVVTVKGQQYQITTLAQSQKSDPWTLAQSYGKQDSWTDMMVVKNGKYSKMTEKLSQSLGDDDQLLIPLSWVSSSTPPPPPPATKPTPPTKPGKAPKPAKPTPPSNPTTPPTKPSNPTTPPATPKPAPVPSGGCKSAAGTYYESYPTTEEEGSGNNGDAYQGIFAFFNDKKSESWVQANNLVAVSDKAFNAYKGKFIQISLNPDCSDSISAQIVDFCSDKDCGGCCSANMKSMKTDFLIDVEKYTLAKLTKQTPQQVVKNSFYRTIYYSLPGANAVADNSDFFQEPTETNPFGLTPLAIGLAVGGVVLLVVLVVVVVVVVRRKTAAEEKV